MKNLIEALIKLQAKLKNPPKTKSVNISATRHYNYADLTDVIDCVKPILTEFDLTLWQRMTVNEAGLFGLVSELAHKSGEMIQSFYPLKTDLKPQDFGSALTYARRYSIMSLLFINGDDDLDGVEIKDRGPSLQNSHFAQVARVNETKSDDGPPPNDWSGLAGPEVNHTEPKSPVKTISEKQVKLLVAKAYGNKWTTKDIHQFFKAKFNVNELKELDWRMMDQAIVFVSKPFEQAMMDIGEIPF